jgi:transposase, IS6 family
MSTTRSIRAWRLAAATVSIKRLTRPMLGFQSFWTAKRMLAGIEAMAMLAKGQVRAVPKGDMPAQRAFVQQIFGLAA